MSYEKKVASLDVNAMAIALAEAQKTRVTQSLSAEDVKQKLPTEQLLREFLLEEVQTNVIAQAAVDYVGTFLNNDLINEHIVSECINFIEEELSLTNCSSQFTKNREQIKSLYLREDDLYDRAFNVADDYICSIDEDDLEQLGEDFGADEIIDQLMVYMLFYQVNSPSLAQVEAARERIFRGEA